MIKKIQFNLDKRKTWLQIAQVVVAAVVVEATSFVQINLLVKSSRQEAALKANSVLSNTEYEIRDVIDEAEQAVKSNMWIVQWCMDNPDSLMSVTRRIVEDTPSVVGSTVALVPGYNKDLPFYAPYAHMVNGEIEELSLATEKYNYPIHEWFIEPLETGSGYWSEPYLDTGGGNILMTTYSRPVNDPHNVTAAIMTADVSLEWLSKRVGKVDIYPQAFSVLLSQKGQVLVGPDDSLLTAFTAQAAYDQVEFDNLKSSMLAGKRGVVALHTTRGISYVHYGPVSRTGWSMAVVIPDRDVYKDVRRMGIICALLQILGLAMLIYILFSVARSWMEYQQTKDIEEKMESELKIGRDIQMSMIPKPLPDRDDLDIAATIVPAKQVGGDLYDYYIRDQKLVFCIGDVSGKGVPASLVMTVTRSLFRNISAQEDDPARIVTEVNNSLMDNMSENEMFVTFFCGVLDLETGQLRYCNAGHNAPFLHTDHVEMMDVLPNLPLGIMEGMVFTGQELALHYNDALYLYTDGVTEAEDSEYHLFGEDRLGHVLKEEGDAQEHLDAVIDAIEDFVQDAPQSDDITMLFIRYLKDNTQPAIMARHLILHNNIQQIPQLAEFVETIAEEKNLDQAMAMSLNLALEEAVTNVILYAYPDGIDGLVDIEAYIHPDCLEFIISDSGKPFDPTAAPEADVTLGVDERQIGGLGIYLVRNIMDTVSYRYEKGKNILIMIKKI